MKKPAIIFCVILLLAMFTNPNKCDFSEYCLKHSGSAGTISYNSEIIGSENNYIYSIFTAKLQSGGLFGNYTGTERYVGVFALF